MTIVVNEENLRTKTRDEVLQIDEIKAKFSSGNHRKDTKTRDRLNKLLGLECLAVFTTSHIATDKLTIDFGAGSILIYTKKETWVEINSSEWASILEWK